jgi:hypothetical protein
MGQQDFTINSGTTATPTMFDREQGVVYGSQLQQALEPCKAEQNEER